MKSDIYNILFPHVKFFLEKNLQNILFWINPFPITHFPKVSVLSPLILSIQHVKMSY